MVLDPLLSSSIASRMPRAVLAHGEPPTPAKRCTLHTRTPALGLTRPHQRLRARASRAAGGQRVDTRARACTHRHLATRAHACNYRRLAAHARLQLCPLPTPRAPCRPPALARSRAAGRAARERVPAPSRKPDLPPPRPPSLAPQARRCCPVSCREQNRERSKGEFGGWDKR